MKLGTSLRFLFPTSPRTHEAFRHTLAAAPAGSFIERPMGAYDTAEQASNWLEVAAAARAAGLDGLLVGDNHAVAPGYANCFSPVPSIARLMAVTGDMPVGMVLLAPFYQPIVLAEQIGTLAAFSEAPLIVTLALGGRAQTFESFGWEMRTRVGRLEELATIVRALLAGERVTFHGRYHTVVSAQISPLPRVPVSLWLAGTVPEAAARRAPRRCLAVRPERLPSRIESAIGGLSGSGGPGRPDTPAGASPRHLRRRDRHRRPHSRRAHPGRRVPGHWPRYAARRRA